MYRRLVWFCLLAMCSSLANAADRLVPLTDGEKAELLAFSNAPVRTSLDALPRKLVELVAGSQGKLAAPGESWQVTDVVVGPVLPGSRLIWYATSGSRTLVHYETGGIAHNYWLLIAEGGATAQVRLRAFAYGALDGPSELKPKIEQSKVLAARP
jgi:hypothetical protein